MKKGLSLFLGAVATLGFASVVNAKTTYNLDKINLSDKDNINSLLRIDKETGNIIGTGELYPLENGGPYGNVYFIGTEAGEVYKPNLYYEDDSYEYIDIEDNKLVGYKASSHDLEDPSKPSSPMTNDDWMVDDSLNYIRMVCPNSYNYGDESNPYYNLPNQTRDGQNFVCAVEAKDGENNSLFGLVMQGKGAKMVLAPSKEYQDIYVDNYKVMLINKDNVGYVLASPDGVIGSFTDYLINKVNDTFDDETNITLDNISAVSYNNDLIYKVVVVLSTEYPSQNRAVYVYDDEIIGEYSAAGDIIKMKNGFTFIEDIPAEKLYNIDGTLLADESHPLGYCYGNSSKCEVITYVRNGQLIFFNGKEEIYSTKYDEAYLPQYEFTDNGRYYFLGGDWKANGAREYIYVLEKEETETPQNESKLLTYKVLEGNNQTYDTKGSALLKFKFDTNYAEFKASGKVYLDGKLVDKKNYEAKEGSTVITFKKEFSSKIYDGKHTVKIVTDLGEGVANFTSIGNPKTFDKIVIMGSLFAISLAGVYTVCKKSKRFN